MSLTPTLLYTFLKSFIPNAPSLELPSSVKDFNSVRQFKTGL